MQRVRALLILVTLVFGACSTAPKSSFVSSPEAVRGIASGSSLPVYTPRDLEVIDRSIQQIVDRILVGEDQVEFARPRFDGTETRIGDEKIKYTLNGRIKDARWSKAGADLSVTSSFSAIRSLKRTGAEISYLSEIKTDVLAMLRYGATVALQKDRGYDPQFESRIIGTLKALSQVNQISMLADLFKEAKAISEDLLRHYSDTKPNNAEQWRLMAEAYRSTEIDSDADGVSLSSDQPLHFLRRLNQKLVDDKYQERVEAQAVRIALNKGLASIRIKLFVRTSSERLDQARFELDKRMSGLKNGDTDVSKQVEQEFIAHLRFFKDVINGAEVY